MTFGAGAETGICAWPIAPQLPSATAASTNPPVNWPMLRVSPVYFLATSTREG